MIGHTKKHANPMPIVDEGWWMSVLTDEGLNMPTVQPRSIDFEPAIRGWSKRGAVDSRSATNWESVKDLYTRDQIVEVVVVGRNRGGLLVEGDGVFGFVPFSHLVHLETDPNTEQRDRELESYIGRALLVKVIESAPEEDRVIFSERAAQSKSGSRSELLHSLERGQTIRGLVTNVTDFGVFVDLGSVEGLIHISELSWGRVSHPGQILKVGETVDARILELEPARNRVALSRKRLMVNPWENAVSEFPVGRVLSATITTVLSFGAFARLDAGIEGLIHVSEIPQADEKPLKAILVEDQEVQVRVLHVDALHHRMGLSMRNA